MASIMTKRGSQDNVVTYEHICDTRADMASIDDKYVTLGSTCIILKGTSGGMEVYIADSNHQWQSLAIAGGSSGSGGTVVVNSSPLFHVCTPNEVRANGTPKISSPEENTIYLVPTEGETNNLFNEYLYVNSKWEMIGSAGIDLSRYVTQSDLNQYVTQDDLSQYVTSENESHVYDFRLPKYASQQSYSEYHSESNPEGGSNHYPCIYTITTEDRQFVDSDRIIISCIAKPNNNHITLQFGNNYYCVATGKVEGYPTANITDLSNYFIPGAYLELIYNSELSVYAYEHTGHWTRNDNYTATGIFTIDYSATNTPHVHRINHRTPMRRMCPVEETDKFISAYIVAFWFNSDEKLIEHEQIVMMGGIMPPSSGAPYGHPTCCGLFITTNNLQYYPVVITDYKYPNDVLEFMQNANNDEYNNDKYNYNKVVTYTLRNDVYIPGPLYVFSVDETTMEVTAQSVDEYEGPAWVITDVSPTISGYFTAKRENTILGHYNEAITQYSGWVKNTSYNIGDCIYNSTEQKSYECIEANSDSTFTKEHWKELPTNYDRLLTIGNGKSSSELSNALTMDSKGNTIISGNFTASGGSLTIGNTTITEAQLISLLNSITG